VKQHRRADLRTLRHTTLLPLLAGCCITGLFVVWCEAETTSDSTTPTSNSSPSAPDAPSEESLREEIARLRLEATSLRRQSARLRSSADSIAADRSLSTSPTPDSLPVAATTLQLPPGPAKDTVQLLSKESTDAFLESLRGRKRSTRQRGYGGAIGPVLGVYAIQMDPIDKLIRFMGNNSDFSNSRITTDKPFALFQCTGISGYGAIGNGLRIGGTYMSGSRSYTTFINDTIFNLEINPSFGGFLLEKAIVLENLNAYAGGLIGSSAITVRPSKTTNALTSISVDSDNFSISFNELKANSLFLELHGGCTYTMINWFHIGADLSAPLFFSNSGFTTSGGHSITNGFLTINPGIRIRIMIGNIG